jgi:pyruvate-formate lyase-activating enzyme
MYIFNIRQGFATNSSSSHSILEFKNLNNQNIDTDEVHDFGWNFFTAFNQEAKENYLSAMIESSLMDMGLKKNQRKKYINDLFQDNKMYDRAVKTMVDHQSLLTLPRNWDNANLNQEFLKEMVDYFRKENVIILGGNDNTEKIHHLYNEDNLSALSELPKESSNNHLIARKEKDYWVIFNRKTGSKLRMSFSNPIAPEKALAPELVDIKITDFCPYNCTFCYQDSTIKGKHANLEDIEKIASALEKAQVFEVALGGGETTLHPQFVEILDIFKKKNIIPNFTTKNFQLLRQKNAEKIINLCGGMAFSIQNIEEMKKVEYSFLDFQKQNLIVNDPLYYYGPEQKIKPWMANINFQYVMGTTDLKEFEKILHIAANMGCRITLLGYKENGRGSSFAPHDYKNWIKVVEKVKKEKSYYSQISIDTALAAEFEEELKTKLDERTYHIKEGAFSAYVDATEMTLAPSSYIGLEQKVTFDENWLENYKTMVAIPHQKKSIKIGK